MDKLLKLKPISIKKQLSPNKLSIIPKIKNHSIIHNARTKLRKENEKPAQKYDFPILPEEE